MGVYTRMIDLDYIKQTTIINDNVDDDLLKHSIVEVQDIYIKPILGTRLYDKLISDIDAQSVTGVYQTLINDYISKAIRQWIIHEVTIDLNYKYTNKAISKQSSDNSESIDTSDVIYLRNQRRNKAEFYSNRITEYLCENETLFIEYRDNDKGDDIHPNSSDDNFFNGMYIEPKRSGFGNLTCVCDAYKCNCK